MISCKPCSPPYNPGWPGWINLAPFRAWCAQTLPTVFDESMSYYEVLCKVLEILNGAIEDIEVTAKQLEDFIKEVNQQFEELKNGTWIEGTIPYLEKLLKQYIPVAMLPGLTEDGYFCIYIPKSWDNIMFATTGYDTIVPCQLEYGHLVMYY